MIYEVAERFKSIQGEGLYTGAPMAFIRFVGCSVGKRICNACDTDFEQALNWRGGGKWTEEELFEWAKPYRHFCLTGGEPLDQDLKPLLSHASAEKIFHIETSGTIVPDWIDEDGCVPSFIHLCVSPKPGYTQQMIHSAHEVKVIVPGLGSGSGWPTIQDALEWSRSRIVYLQPRNAKLDVDKQNLLYVQDLIREHPQLRLSVQLHKVLKVQ